MALRIAVVDDNPADSKLMGLAIHRIDPSIELVVIEDGRKALEFFADLSSSCCDLVLLDLNLPIVDGFEVLEHLKSDPALRPIPVIVLSGSSNRDDVEHSYRLGANSYVCKPAGIEGVFAMVEELIRYWFHLAQRPKFVEPGQAVFNAPR